MHHGDFMPTWRHAYGTVLTVTSRLPGEVEFRYARYADTVWHKVSMMQSAIVRFSPCESAGRTRDAGKNAIEVLGG